VDMPQRHARILQIMQMEDAKRRLDRIGTSIATAFPEEPELGVVFACGFQLLSLQCGLLLEELKRRWNPYVEVTNRPRTLTNFDDDTLRGCFRFGRVELEELMGILEIPIYFKAPGDGRIFEGEESFLLLLRRLAGRETGVQLAKIFDRTPPAISEMYNVALDHVYRFASVAMRLELWEDDLLEFSKILQENGCPLPHCCGFVDGTMFDICRPVVAQESMYNGWKRGHKTKYQCVVLPNFLIGDWFGPASGRTNDSAMLGDSRLIERLTAMVERLGVPLHLYGDSAYPSNAVLKRAPKGNQVLPEETALAKQMSKYRESVEWVFGKIGNLWPFITDKTRKQTGLRATGKEDCVAALLTNFHTCAYGGVANRYFNSRPPSMHAYKSKFTMNPR